MADRTYFTFRVHHVPADKVDAFADALQNVFDYNPDEWAGTETWEEVDRQPDGTYRVVAIEHTFAEALRRGEDDFHDEEVTCGTVDNGNYQPLIDAVPDAIWECWEDPKFEWMGSWVGYSPATGLTGPVESDADGQQNVTFGRAVSVLAEVVVDGQPLDEKVVKAVLYKLFPQQRFYDIGEPAGGGDSHAADAG